MSPKELINQSSLWIVNKYLKYYRYIFCLHFILYLHVWIRIGIRNTDPDPGSSWIPGTDPIRIQIHNTAFMYQYFRENYRKIENNSFESSTNRVRIQVRLALNFLKKLNFAKFVASKKKNCDKKRLNVLMTRRRRQNTFLLKASLRKIIIIFRNWQDLLKFHRRSLQYGKNYWPPQSHFYTKILIAKAYYWNFKKNMGT